MTTHPPMAVGWTVRFRRMHPARMRRTGRSRSTAASRMARSRPVQHRTSSAPTTRGPTSSSCATRPPARVGRIARSMTPRRSVQWGAFACRSRRPALSTVRAYRAIATMRASIRTAARVMRSRATTALGHACRLPMARAFALRPARRRPASAATRIRSTPTRPACRGQCASITVAFSPARTTRRRPAGAARAVSASPCSISRATTDRASAAPRAGSSPPASAERTRTASPRSVGTRRT